MNTNQYAALFASAFVVQQSVEIIDTILNPLIGWDDPANPSALWKKAVLKIFALGIAIAMTSAGWDAIQALRDPRVSEIIWAAAAVLSISAGTEGVNSFLKFLTYAKEDKKATAAKIRGEATPEMLRATARS